MTESLFNQVGGREGIKHLIPKFYAKVINDPELKPFFVNADLNRLQKMQMEFFSMALGGPVNFSELDLYAVHRGRGIQRRHLTKFTEHLLETLHEQGLPNSMAKNIVASIATYSNEILGEAGVDG